MPGSPKSPHTNYWTGIAPALLLIALAAGTVVVASLDLGVAGATAADSGVASGLVNSCMQVGGSIGAAILNTLSASGAANYLAGHPTNPDTNAAAATVHGDLIALVALVGIFIGGAAITALTYRSAGTKDRPATADAAFSPPIPANPSPAD